MRRFRKIVTILALTVLLLSGLLTGALAISLYANFGSGKSITAEGPVIDVNKLENCSVVLMDLERIDSSWPDYLSHLPSAREEIEITLSPESTFTAGLFPRKSVDEVILGFDTCIATLKGSSWSLIHSAAGRPIFPLRESEALIVSGTGTSVSFDVRQAVNSTLVIAHPDQDSVIQQIALDAKLRFPNANMWALGLFITSGVVVVLFIAFTVVYIVHMNRRPGS